MQSKAHAVLQAPVLRSPAMRRFWIDAKNALYLAKKKIPDMAFTIALRACAAVEVLTAADINLGTLEDVITILSPTNANAHLQLRI